MLYGRFSRANIMSSRVSECALLRLAEKAIPTEEKRRSTDADMDGQPKYCRAMRYRPIWELLLVVAPPVQHAPLILELHLWHAMARYSISSS